MNSFTGHILIRLFKPSLSARGARAFSLETTLKQTRSTTNSLGIIQIDDLKNNGRKRSQEEHERCKLAALYRLVDLNGWSMNIYNHITTRCSSNPDHFLINPFGLLYSEVTASSLIKIDSKCNVIEKGSTSYGVNKAGFVLHSTIHEARRDINTIVHIHSGLAAGVVASLKSGLMPVSQEAFIVNEVTYHDYAGILVDEPMRARIIADLGRTSKIMALRNHGVVVCGSTLEETWRLLTTFMIAAEIQFYALAAANGIQNVVVPAKEIVGQVQRVVKDGVNEKSEDGIEWRFGEMETEADMRRLDRLGYKTGYPYKKKPEHL